VKQNIGVNAKIAVIVVNLYYKYSLF